MASLKWFVAGTFLVNVASANLNVLIAPPVTAAPEFPRLAKRQVAACSRFIGIESSCEAATQGFTDLPISSQVSCLCSTASAFDNAYQSCLSYLSTAQPDLYSSFAGGPSTPCAAYSGGSGGGAGGASSASITSTRTSSRSSASRTATGTVDTSDPNYQACSSLASEESSCEAATPSFTSLGATRQASCLCYQGSTFAPDNYDENREGCISYLKTANPTQYQSFIRSGGNTATSLCSSIGDVVNGNGPTTTTRRGGPTSTPAAATTSSTTSSPNIAPTGFVEAGSFAVAAGALALAVLL